MFMEGNVRSHARAEHSEEGNPRMESDQNATDGRDHASRMRWRRASGRSGGEKRHGAAQLRQTARNSERLTFACVQRRCLSSMGSRQVA